MKNSSLSQLKKISLSAIFAALIFLATAYLPRIPFAGGYIHIGDSILYLAAAFLPTPYACVIASLGAGLADALTGYMIWLPATLVVKAIMAAFFSCKTQKLFCTRNLIAALLAGLVGCIGYYLWEAVLTKSLIVPLESLPYNLIQAAASAIIFAILAVTLDRFDLKKKI